MSTEVIVLITLAIASTVVNCVLVLWHLRRIRVVESKNSPTSFCIMLPQYYVLLGFVGFCVTMIMLVAFSIMQIISVYIQIILGLFALLLTLFVFGVCIYKIVVDNGAIEKQTLVGKKQFNLSDITQKKLLSFGYCIKYFKEDKLVFTINQDCIGFEYMQELTKKISEVK